MARLIRLGKLGKVGHLSIGEDVDSSDIMRLLGSVVGSDRFGNVASLTNGSAAESGFCDDPAPSLQ